MIQRIQTIYLLLSAAVAGGFIFLFSLWTNKDGFEVFSFGADGKSVAPLTAKASHDDIIRASNGGYYGYGENY